MPVGLCFESSYHSIGDLKRLDLEICFMGDKFITLFGDHIVIEGTIIYLIIGCWFMAIVAFIACRCHCWLMLSLLVVSYWLLLCGLPLLHVITFVSCCCFS